MIASVGYYTNIPVSSKGNKLMFSLMFSRLREHIRWGFDRDPVARTT